MTGKPDAIVQYRDRLWILELKTAKRRYGKSTMLDIDLQMGAYLWMVRSLGLRRIRHEVERLDTPAVRGMVNKVPHLVEIVEEGS